MQPLVVSVALLAEQWWPDCALLLPAALADKLVASWPKGFAGPIAIFRNWSFCLFYVMAELWGSVVVSLLFWGFANQVSHCCMLSASAQGRHPRLAALSVVHSEHW